MLTCLVIALCLVAGIPGASAQYFQRIPAEAFSLRGQRLQFRDILVTATGNMIITTNRGLARIAGRNLQIDLSAGEPRDQKGRFTSFAEPNIVTDLSVLHVGIKSITEGPNGIVYVLSDRNNIGWIDYNREKRIGVAPFRLHSSNSSKLWMDKTGDLFIAAGDTCYWVKKAWPVLVDNKPVPPRPVRAIYLGRGVEALSFGTDPADGGMVYIGTTKGLYKFEKRSGYLAPAWESREPLSITAFDIKKWGFSTWLSTLQKGMVEHTGYSDGPALEYVLYHPRYHATSGFSRVSDKLLLVLLRDTLPAFFNTETRTWQFVSDTALANSTGPVTDAKVGAEDIMAVIRNGDLYISPDYLGGHSLYVDVTQGPYLRDLQINTISYRARYNYNGRLDALREIHLPYYENSLGFFFGVRGLQPQDTVVFSYKLDNYSKDWQQLPEFFFDEKEGFQEFSDLPHGTYTFRLRARKGSGDWMPQQVALSVVIAPPFWKTTWFWVVLISLLSAFIYAIVKWRENVIRRQERRRARHEKELMEMEARALRAQMNPHFIFNCMNSIKALIQTEEKEKAIEYLTTFSKLIRTLFQNANKRQVTLYEELETCKYYTQLEKLRFGDNVRFVFDIDPSVDLKSVMVPALIIQPFIENAIWHGIVPKEEGGTITVLVKQNGDIVSCTIDDDGIGRELSLKNKPATSLHESKGVSLSRERLTLEKLLNETQTSIAITDKYVDASPTGTRVTLQFNLS